MGYSNYWKFVDELTVAEVAALWCGVEPSSSPQHIPAQARNFLAIKRMVTSAIKKGALPAKLKPAALAIDDYSSSAVSRDDLSRWAISVGERPAFLFDSLLEATVERSVGAGENTTELAECADPSRSEQMLSPTRRQVGRPREYDWDGAIIEIIRIADMDNLPAKQADVTRMLAEWFLRKEEKEPSTSEINKLVSRVYNTLKQSGWEASGGSSEPLLKTSGK